MGRSSKNVRAKKTDEIEFERGKFRGRIPRRERAVRRGGENARTCVNTYKYERIYTRARVSYSYVLRIIYALYAADAHVYVCIRTFFSHFQNLGRGGSGGVY